MNPALRLLPSQATDKPKQSQFSEIKCSSITVIQHKTIYQNLKTQDNVSKIKKKKDNVSYTTQDNISKVIM